MLIPSPLLSDDTVIVLAQALTGLGHLRVTHALYRGLPKEADPILLSSQDETVNYIHKLTSISPFFRRVFEFSQKGWTEDVFTWCVRRYFRQHTKKLGEQLLTVLDQRIVHPRTLMVVATHFILAHQFAAIKDDFAQKNNVRVVLAVVVTDDSPQHLWAVGGADFIVVPSEYTKRKLEEYHHTQHDMLPSRYIVLPYLVSPRLVAELTPSQLRRRGDQMRPYEKTAIHMAIPISGAAVQLGYIEKLMQQLSEQSDRYIFHVVSLQSGTTQHFLRRLKTSTVRGTPRIFSSASHREVVELYEKLYEQQVIALEVTKPSEQSFKILLSPRLRGGATLLFSDPVGRQEHDNLRFMIRHHLIPTKEEHIHVWNLARANKPPDKEVLTQAASWRGLLLPFHSGTSAQFIHWCLEQGIFAQMVRFSRYPESHELSTHGVELFWNSICEYSK